MICSFCLLKGLSAINKLCKTLVFFLFFFFFFLKKIYSEIISDWLMLGFVATQLNTDVINNPCACFWKAHQFMPDDQEVDEGWGKICGHSGVGGEVGCWHIGYQKRERSLMVEDVNFKMDASCLRLLFSKSWATSWSTGSCFNILTDAL